MPKTTLLRAFIPTEGRLFKTPDGERFELLGDAVFEAHGCSGRLSLKVGTETLALSVTPVQDGESIVIKRGGNIPDHREKFAKAGVLLTAPIPARSEALSMLRRGKIGLKLNWDPTEGCRRQRGRETVFAATGCYINGVTLAPPEKADALIDFIL